MSTRQEDHSNLAVVATLASAHVPQSGILLLKGLMACLESPLIHIRRGTGIICKQRRSICHSYYHNRYHHCHHCHNHVDNTSSHLHPTKTNPGALTKKKQKSITMNRIKSKLSNKIIINLSTCEALLHIS